MEKKIRIRRGERGEKRGTGEMKRRRDKEEGRGNKRKGKYSNNTKNQRRYRRENKLNRKYTKKRK